MNLLRNVQYCFMTKGHMAEYAPIDVLEEEVDVVVQDALVNGVMQDKGLQHVMRTLRKRPVWKETDWA